MFSIRRAGAALAVLGLMGCNHDASSSDQAGASKTDKPSESKVAAATPEASPTAPPWPDGWLVVSEEEWIPVLDRAGQDLQRARLAFQKGERKQATDAVRAASMDIRTDESTRPANEHAQLDKARTDLDAFATVLDGKTEVKLEDLDRAFANAYRSDVSVDWTYLKEESWTPTFERPAEHFKKALALLDEGHEADAAAEIRRGAGYFRLAANSARSDDKDLLQHQVTNLSNLAKRADAGVLKAPELRDALVQADNAYAESYLHQAETSWSEKQSLKAGRALHEAVARIRARAHWLGQESEQATRSAISDLDALSDKLKRGLATTSKEIKSALERVRALLHTNRGAEPKPEAG